MVALGGLTVRRRMTAGYHGEAVGALGGVLVLAQRGRGFVVDGARAVGSCWLLVSMRRGGGGQFLRVDVGGVLVLVARRGALWLRVGAAQRGGGCWGCSCLGQVVSGTLGGSVGAYRNLRGGASLHSLATWQLDWGRGHALQPRPATTLENE